jgi:helix-turn-helix protein
MLSPLKRARSKSPGAEKADAEKKAVQTSRAMFEKLTLKSVNIRAVLVPLRRPVVSKVGLFKEWPLILIDLYTREGVVGRSYLEPYLKNAAGRKRARQNGIRFGRKPKLTAYQRQEALVRLAQGESQSTIARTFNVDRATISRLARQ